MEKVQKVKYVEWCPRFKVGDKSIYQGEVVEILHRACNKSYFVNENDVLLLVYEEELTCQE